MLKLSDKQRQKLKDTAIYFLKKFLSYLSLSRGGQYLGSRRLYYSYETFVWDIIFLIIALILTLAYYLDYDSSN